MNETEIAYWNGPAGQKWVAMQEPLDVMLESCTAELRARAGSVGGLRVLDIGCGTGETCALLLHGGAEVTGVDISAPMLAVARERTAGKAVLVEADASVWISETPFDLAMSRFGVMFFDDPAVAFANIAANIRRGGRLIFTCWRAMEENEWVMIPMNAVRDLLLEPPSLPPRAFAFADRERLGEILQRAGFADILIERRDVPICLAGTGGAQAAVRHLMQIGPTAAALASATTEARAAAVERLQMTLAAHDRDGRVMLGGSMWMVEAVKA